MRDEVTSIKWLSLGALAAAVPQCTSAIRHDEFEDVEGEREVLRSIFVGSFMAAVFSLPLDFSDEERSFIIDTIEEDVRFDILWKVAVPWYALLMIEDTPTLNHQTRIEVYRIHLKVLARDGDPLRGHIPNVVNMSTRLALRIFSSYLIDFECPDGW